MEVLSSPEVKLISSVFCVLTKPILSWAPGIDLSPLSEGTCMKLAWWYLLHILKTHNSWFINRRCCLISANKTLYWLPWWENFSCCIKIKVCKRSANYFFNLWRLEMKIYNRLLLDSGIWILRGFIIDCAQKLIVFESVFKQDCIVSKSSTQVSVISCIRFIKFSVICYSWSLYLKSLKCLLR